MNNFSISRGGAKVGNGPADDNFVFIASERADIPLRDVLIGEQTHDHSARVITLFYGLIDG